MCKHTSVLANMWIILLVKVFVVLLVVAATDVDAVEDGGKKIVVARCPPLKSDVEGEAKSYCDCSYHDSFLPLLRIKCNFSNTEDVLLNDEIFEFGNLSLGETTVWVRIMKATSLKVTWAFHEKLMQSHDIISSFMELGTVFFDSFPEPEPGELNHSSSYARVSINNCYVPELPKYFLSDRMFVSLGIKRSRVGNISSGILHRIEKIGHLFFEDSTIDIFEGPIATEGYINLYNKERMDIPYGLRISNTTIDTISSGTFNLTNKSDLHEVKVVDSNIGNLNENALVVSGDIDVIIQKNVFLRMENEAIKVEVTGDVVFAKNDVRNWKPDALKGLICPTRPSLVENTFRVNVPTDIAINISTTPFHASCGNPQLSLIVEPRQCISPGPEGSSPCQVCCDNLPNSLEMDPSAGVTEGGVSEITSAGATVGGASEITSAGVTKGKV